MEIYFGVGVGYVILGGISTGIISAIVDVTLTGVQTALVALLWPFFLAAVLSEHFMKKVIKLPDMLNSYQKYKMEYEKLRHRNALIELNRRASLELELLSREESKE